MIPGYVKRFIDNNNNTHPNQINFILDNSTHRLIDTFLLYMICMSKDIMVSFHIDESSRGEMYQYQ